HRRLAQGPARQPGRRLSHRLGLALLRRVARDHGRAVPPGPVLLPPDRAALRRHRMKPIISVEQLGKAYHLGRKVDKNATLRDAVTEFGRHAATRLRQRFSEPAEGGADAFWAVKDASFSVNRGE